MAWRAASPNVPPQPADQSVPSRDLYSPTWTSDTGSPTESNQTAIVDWYVDAFPNTPLVMLVGGPAEYAVSQGAGWRGPGPQQVEDVVPLPTGVSAGTYALDVAILTEDDSTATDLDVVRRRSHWCANVGTCKTKRSLLLHHCLCLPQSLHLFPRPPEPPSDSTLSYSEPQQPVKATKEQAAISPPSAPHVRSLMAIAMTIVGIALPRQSCKRLTRSSHPACGAKI